MMTKPMEEDRPIRIKRDAHVQIDFKKREISEAEKEKDDSFAIQ